MDGKSRAIKLSTIVSTMLLPHVIVNTPTGILLRKCIHANPAYMGPATDTGHMVTATSLLEVSMTFRTRLDVVLLPPLAKSVKTAFQIVTMFGTRQTLMKFHMARTANSIQAGRALKSCAFLRRSVYDFAVWCRTIVELSRT
jgi:hypothetical protein